MANATTKYWETREFKALKIKWYQILRDAGFKDIEREKREYIVNPQWFRDHKIRKSSGAEYSDYCNRILETFRFRLEVHKVIFQWHSEGISEQDISNKLFDSPYRQFSRKQVSRIIDRTKQDYARG